VFIFTSEYLLTENSRKFVCPYCDRESASPGGIRFHIKLTHPERLDEFNANIYPDMEAKFQALIEEQ
jgi:hypothetical protein